MDNEDVWFAGELQAVGLLTHPVHPPHSSLASLKNIGSEPLFTLADHTSVHTHTQSTETHTLGHAIVHSAGVSASVPSTPWTST